MKKNRTACQVQEMELMDNDVPPKCIFSKDASLKRLKDTQVLWISYCRPQREYTIGLLQIAALGRNTGN